jgi:hypothetical protein
MKMVSSGMLRRVALVSTFWDVTPCGFCKKPGMLRRMALVRTIWDVTPYGSYKSHTA